MSKIKIILMSNNLHKMNEIYAFFDGKITFIMPEEIGIINLPEENGKNFVENARLKVNELADNFDFPILGDDSGLIVRPLSDYITKIKSEKPDFSILAKSLSDFFDKEYRENIFKFWTDFLPDIDKFPGVLSKRFGYIEQENVRNRYLLSLLEFINKKIGKENRSFKLASAYFETCLALKFQNKIYTFNGKTSGFIVKNPKGNNGFGYDPIFFYPPLKKTFAELSLEEKNKVSHRSKALEKLKIFFDDLNII